MDGGDLFAAEAEALHRATAVLADPASEPASHRAALEELVQHYGQLMRQSRRLISRSDRTERELNLLNARLTQLSDELDYKARHDNLRAPSIAAPCSSRHTGSWKNRRCR
jgi:tRNA C32,U32 (ribose-2'-O)-methylase TrmJ